MHTVALRDVEPQAWRNGGGVTHELLAWPRADDWLLRISVATIDRDGAFSAFPGVERWFTVLEGPGVTLDFAHGQVRLGPGHAPLPFAGEAAPMCTLTAGTTRDLNLMCRRGAAKATLAIAAAGSELMGPTLWRGIYAAEALTLDISGVTHHVAPATLAWSDDSDTHHWRRRHEVAAAWWLTLAP